MTGTVRIDGEDGGVVLENADKKMVLMKVSTFIAESLKETSIQGGELGRIRVAFDPRDPQPEVREYSLHLAPREGIVIPLDYVVKYTPEDMPLQVFSESAEGKVAVEGKVEGKFDVQPSNDPRYRMLIKSRDRIHNTPKRQLRMWQGDKGVAQLMPLPGDSLAAFAKDKRKGVLAAEKQQVKPSDAKRVRMSKTGLESLVFKLFEQQHYYNLRQLTDATDQPQQFLKDVLNDLCVYNKRGQHQGMYELKPEYKLKAGDQKPDIL